MTKMRKAVFFDRDGVINRDVGYVGTIDRFEFLPGVVDSLVRLRLLGYALVLVTNQSGIARGFYSLDDFRKLSDFMQSELRRHQAQFDKIYFCPHHPQARIEEFRCVCVCRKPQPGMFFSAQKDLNIDMKESFMVGDHASDIIAADRAGVGNLVLVGDHLAEESPRVPQAICYADLEDFSFCLGRRIMRAQRKAESNLQDQ